MTKNPLTAYLLIALAAVVLVLFALQDYASRLPQPPVQEQPVIRADDETLGADQTAPLVLVGFGNYTCSDCAALSNVLRAAAERFGTRVLVSWRDYVPAGADQLALHAAVAARCAAYQGKYWQAHEFLFSAPQALSEEVLSSLSVQLGLQEDAYESCRTTEAARTRVLAAYDEAQALSVTTTPVYFLNSVRYTGVPDMPTFLDWLETQSP